VKKTRAGAANGGVIGKGKILKDKKIKKR